MTVLKSPSNLCLQSKEEFDEVLDKHKAYVKSKFPNYPGSGQDAYADAGDLGADPEEIKADRAKAAHNGTNGTNGTNGHSVTNGKSTATNGNGLTNGNHTAKSTVAAA